MRSPVNGREVSQGPVFGRSHIIRNLAALAALGWLIVALLKPASFSQPATEPIVRGLLSGTLFGLVTLTAAWTVFGPLAVRWRMAIAAGMLMLLVVAIALNVCLGRPSAWPEIVAVAPVMAAQWVLVQGPLWALVIRYGLRIAEAAQLGEEASGRQQFSIRELLVLTTCTAVLLALARAIVGGLSAAFVSVFLKQAPLLAIIAASNAVVTIPCLVAPLLPRAVVANLAAFLFAAVIAIIEAQLARALSPGRILLRDYLFFEAFNMFQCAWVVAAAILLRWSGFRLASAGKA